MMEKFDSHCEDITLSQSLNSATPWNHGTHQDRLIKKLGRKGLIATKPPTSIWKKNICRRTTDGLRFQQLSRRTITVASRVARDLREIFRLETERGISNDWVIRHEGGNLQLKPGSRRYGPTRSNASVCEWEDGTMEVYQRGEAIAFTELKKQPQKASAPLPPRARPVVVQKAKQDHPWRQAYESMRPRVPNRAIAAPPPQHKKGDISN